MITPDPTNIKAGDTPHGRETELAGFAVEAIEKHPAYDLDKVIVIVTHENDDGSSDSGLGCAGYYDETTGGLNVAALLAELFTQAQGALQSQHPTGAIHIVALDDLN